MEITIEQALQKGISAHKKGELREAENLYRAIIQSQPLHPDANHNLGVLAVSINKAETALPLFKTALESNPKIEQFWLSYIDALIKEKQFDNAKQVLEQAKKQGVDADRLNSLEVQIFSKTQKADTTILSPPKELLDSLLGYYQNGRLSDAEKLALEITQDFPKHQFAWKILGVVLGATGRKSEAVDANQMAVELSPQDASVHNNLGITLKGLGRLDEAEASYNQAIALKPDLAEAHSNLGATLKELRRLDEAEASYNQAIELKPDYAEAYNNLGTIHLELDRLEEAEASYNQAIDLKPDFAEAHSNLGVILFGLGRLKEAEASYIQAIELKPDYTEAHNNLGNTLKELGRLEEAEASYIQAIELKPDYIEVHNNLGNTLKELGRLEEAEASYNQAIELKPDYAEAYNNLGTILQEFDRLEEAEASYSQAIELKPDYVKAYWNLQGIQKNIKGAEHWIAKCLEINKNHIKARLTRAALRFYQGDKSDFNNLMQSELKDHHYMRSFSWVFSLPNLPELYFNKWFFFDAVIKKSITVKPFYEFGVWRASSFKYLIKFFKKGYGFDTFTGLPEDWDAGNHVEKKGTYTSDGNVPKIKGGEFIVGKFEDTLPVFFSESRPIASVINFDADLYSSTICALNFSKQVIDKDTILIFDEFIINESWEQDEFKALNEFCSNNKYSYEVIAISFFTKQVAVKLIGI